MSLNLSPIHSDDTDDDDEEEEDEDGGAKSSPDITLNLENEHDGISNTRHSSLEAEASHVSGMPHHRRKVRMLSTKQQTYTLNVYFYASCVLNFYQRKNTSMSCQPLSGVSSMFCKKNVVF